MKEPARHVDVLDAIRGTAIFSVLMAHCLFTAYGGTLIPWHGWFPVFSLQPSFWMMFPFSLGVNGVAIFFVVSGFCIHSSFQQNKNWKSFFIRRFFRIYPPYFFAVVLFAFAFPKWLGHLNLQDGKDQAQLLTHLLLLQNISPQYLGGINGSFWSLAVEAQLYLIYPLLLLLVSKLDWRKTMMLLAGIEVLVRLTASIVHNSSLAQSNFAAVSWFISYSPFGFWFSWALGAWIAEAFRQKKTLPLLGQSIGLWSVVALVSYLVKPLEDFRFIVFAMLTAIATSKLLNGNRSKFQIPNFAGRFLRQLGEWSYGIYLVHQPLLYLIFYPVVSWTSLISYPFYDYLSQPPYQNHFGLILRFLVCLALLAIVIPLGVLWFRLAEQPSIAWGKRFVGWLNGGKKEKA